MLVNIFPVGPHLWVALQKIPLVLLLLKGFMMQGAQILQILHSEENRSEKSSYTTKSKKRVHTTNLL